MKINGRPEGGGTSGKIEEVTITSNGNYDNSPNGWNPIHVSVPPSLYDMTVSSNGDYNVDENHDYFGTVSVDVDMGGLVSGLTVSSNGTYFASTGTGWDEVSVDVNEGDDILKAFVRDESPSVIMDLEGRVSILAALRIANVDNLSSIYLPKCHLVGQGAIRDNIHLRNVNMPNLINIEWGGMMNNINLTVFTAPKLLNFQAYAFSNCRGLLAIDFPNMSSIYAEHVFESCTQLGYVSLPKLETLRGTGVFGGCYALHKLSFPMLRTMDPYTINGLYSDHIMSLILDNESIVCTLTSYPGNWYGNPNFKIYVPDGLIDTYRSATNWNRISSKILPITQLYEN